ncbi:hypothetical protein [Runella aurantiaca]|uniref:Uncharacterized protein n=1 Tax=Runella aurantiaca TaxID=2282308 RepID=A0A369IBG0_9BACT|nr:hypothetical protein [Runella aurantiaca]RDB05615.1 hypothetical protein DVG78_13645 [Runella aurantiaca]
MSTDMFKIPYEAEVNAKLLDRIGIFSSGYAEHKMAKIRKALGLRKVTIGTFCDFYKIDPVRFSRLK